MYENFAGCALQAIGLAKLEAKRVGFKSVFSEELLIGLYDEGFGVAAHVLRNLGVSPFRGSGVAASGDNEVTLGDVVKCSLDEAKKFALELGHTYIGTEHLLVGLVRARGPEFSFRAGTDRFVKGREVEQEVLRYLRVRDRKPDECLASQKVCPDKPCVRSAEPGHEIMSAYLNRTVDELRAELKAEKELNRKLWVAIAHIQAANGKASSWRLMKDVSKLDADEFTDDTDCAFSILSGIVSLKEATDAG